MTRQVSHFPFCFIRRCLLRCRINLLAKIRRQSERLWKNSCLTPNGLKQKATWITARKTYDQVERQAAELGENAAEAEALLNKGRVIEALVQQGEADFQVDAAKQAYERALSIGTARQRLLAGNDLCVLLTNQGKYSEAIERWRTVNYSGLEPSERFVYDYNFGRALEGNGDFKEAYDKYKRSVMQQPKFDAAGDAA